MAIALLLHFDNSSNETIIHDSSSNNLIGTNYLNRISLSPSDAVFGVACGNFQGQSVGESQYSINNVAIHSSGDYTLRFRFKASAFGWGSLNCIKYQGIIITFSEYGLDVWDSSVQNYILPTFKLWQDVQYAISIEKCGSTTFVYVDGVLTGSNDLNETFLEDRFTIKANDADFKLDELMLDTAVALAGGASSYTVETVAFTTESSSDTNVLSITEYSDLLVGVATVGYKGSDGLFRTIWGHSGSNIIPNTPYTPPYWLNTRGVLEW